MEEAESPYRRANDEVSLLDLLVTLAENIKLLVLGSLFVGICALGIGFLLPKTFQSVAVLQAEQATASLMTTASVLDPVIAALELAKDGTVEEARNKLRGNIKAAVGRSDKLLTLTVSASTPEQSNAIAAAVLQQTFQESRPKGSIRVRLESQLSEATSRLENARDASRGVLKRLESSSGGVEEARGYAELLNATGVAQTQISALEVQLEGVSDAQLVQAPTLPKKPSQPKKAVIVMGATLGAGVALLLFIFMRQALRTTSKNETDAAKVLRIRTSLGLN